MCGCGSYLPAFLDNSLTTFCCFSTVTWIVNANPQLFSIPYRDLCSTLGDHIHCMVQCMPFTGSWIGTCIYVYNATRTCDVKAVCKMVFHATMQDGGPGLIQARNFPRKDTMPKHQDITPQA